MGSLLHEFAGQAAVTPKTIEWLAGYGIGAGVVFGPHASTVGVDRIAITGDLYEPDPQGQPAIIVPVSFEYEPEWFEPFDLVAWLPDDPARLYRRTDVADILNPVAIERAAHFGEPLALWSSPRAWLQAGLAGAVILDWRSYLSLHLGGLKVLCDTKELAERLSRKVASEQRAAQPTIRTRGIRHAA